MTDILYLAGPMTGYPDLNYPAFNRTAEVLRKVGYIVLNPADIDAQYGQGLTYTWDWYMRHAIRMVLDAQGMAMMSGWEQSKGATLEHRIAKDLGMPVMTLTGWLSAAQSTVSS